MSFVSDTASIIGLIFLALVFLYVGARLLWMAFFRSLNDFLNARNDEEIVNGDIKKEKQE